MVLSAMISLGFVALLAVSGTAGSGQASERVIVRERIIVRVPVRAIAVPQTPIWHEKRGPRCIPADGIAGAAVTRTSDVDFVLKGGRRFRAMLESDCPALDYDSGFYILPTKDRQICAGRDLIHARSGGECEIKRFKKLVRDK